MLNPIMSPMAQYPMHGTGWGGGGSWFHFMPFGWGGILIIIGLVVFLVALIRQRRSGEGFGAPQRETPLDALKRRYANGEITREEFLDIKKDLEG